MIFLLGAALFAQKLEQVHIWRDGAELTYSSRARCVNNVAYVDFSGLNSSLNSETIHFDAFDQKLISHQLYRTHLTDEGNLEQELVDLDAELKAIELDLLLLKDKHEQISSYEIYFQLFLREDLKSENPNRSEWTKAMNTLTTEREAVEYERLTLERRKKEIIRRERYLESQNRSVPSSLGATVVVTCERDVEVELVGFVPLASWSPVYEMQIDESSFAKSEIELRLSALITQTTGQDWGDVELMLSDSEYGRNTLKHVAPVLVEGVNPLSVSTPERLAPRVLVREPEEDKEPIERIPSYQSIRLPHEATLWSSEEQWVPITGATVNAEFENRSVPMYDTAVFRTVLFSVPTELFFGSAPVQVFQDNVYSGTVLLNPESSESQMAVFLEEQKGLVVSRELLGVRHKQNRKSEENSWFYDFKIVVNNSSQQTQKVVVLEPVPNLYNYGIEILSEKTTKDYVWREFEQSYSWEIDVPKDESKEIFVSYEIKVLGTAEQ